MAGFSYGGAAPRIGKATGLIANAMKPKQARVMAPKPAITKLPRQARIRPAKIKGM